MNRVEILLIIKLTFLVNRFEKKKTMKKVRDKFGVPIMRINKIIVIALFFVTAPTLVVLVRSFLVFV